MARYSHTKLSTYQNCPQKYKFRYIDGVEESFVTIEAFVGQLVHASLAKLYSVETSTSRSELLTFYDNEWKERFGPHVVTVRADRSAQSYFETGKKLLTEYYERHAPFHEGQTIGIEAEVSFSLTEDSEFHGVVDRITQTGTHEYEIHDYKTSSRLPSERDIHSDRQLSMYELAVRKKWPEAQNVTLVWHYLRFGKEFRLQKQPTALEQAQAKSLKVIQSIEQATTFPAKESPLCNWCGYRDSCPAKQGSTVNNRG